MPQNYVRITSHIDDLHGKFLKLTYIFLTCQGNSVELFCRTTMGTVENTIGFIPDNLSDANLAEVAKKRASIGAVFNGHWNKLPTGNAGILWEVDVDLNPPAKMKPLKPKLWLLGKQTLKVGLIYKVSA